MGRRVLTSLAVLVFSSCAFADSTAWDVTGQNQFGALDLNNGNFTALITFPFIAAGLGVDGNMLYSAVSGGSGLYSVNPVNGSTALIGNMSGNTYFAFGSTATGLYMLDTTGSLWNINSTTGAATRIGSTLLPIGANTVGLSAGASTLYIANGANIYSVDTTNAHATYIGNSGATDFGALVDAGGGIYGTSIVNANQIYSLDPTTGISTLLTASNAGDYSYGLAPMIPEPGSFLLLGLAGLLFGGYALKRKLA